MTNDLVAFGLEDGVERVGVLAVAVPVLDRGGSVMEVHDELRAVLDASVLWSSAVFKNLQVTGHG